MDKKRRGGEKEQRVIAYGATRISAEVTAPKAGKQILIMFIWDDRQIQTTP